MTLTIRPESHKHPVLIKTFYGCRDPKHCAFVFGLGVIERGYECEIVENPLGGYQLLSPRGDQLYYVNFKSEPEGFEALQ